MNKRENQPFLTGYLLLPPSRVSGYRGVDRDPFQPALLNEEMDSSIPIQGGESSIWSFYPPGWRRDAYRIYEENTVKETEDTLLYLLTNLNAAREIQRIIEPRIGTHDIVRCVVRNLESNSRQNEIDDPIFLGYDVAYPGGDFYSSVLSGLFINPHPILVRDYKALLNEFGLFPNTTPIPAYIHRFRELHISEAKSEFVIFQLHLEL